MLSGVKFIPRDQLSTGLDSLLKDGKKFGGRKDKRRRKKKSSKYDTSDDEGSEKIKKSSNSREKWYSSDECSSSTSGTEIDSDNDGKKRRSKRKEKKNHKLKKDGKRRKKHESESYSSSTSESEDGSCKGDRDKKESERKEMGLDWMLKPESNPTRKLPAKVDAPEEPQVGKVKKPNPREMNPYLKGDGSGYPEDVEPTKPGGVQLPSSSVVGDGGASWRLKALKRAQEQAARGGRNLKEVAEERWGSLGQLTVSVAASRAAPAHAHAHFHAIKDRRRGIAEKGQGVSEEKVNQSEKPYGGRGSYLKDVSLRHLDMRTPKVHDSLSWRKRKEQNISEGDSQLISAAA
ncbi:Cwfj-like family protein [Thalictrum thalictroides]|uniref:Cwfj-like family protein n=1 Tax=Thalictrum thalictroides TaxID=46969 RepID=A0A7J6WS13_THATH|nr:Cwfj-like family protein [Thalictrum thalictroides]